MRYLLFALACAGLSGCSGPSPQNDAPIPDSVWLSVVGTNDVHGELTGEDRGLVTFSGYVHALREHRARDGAVLLLDAGDMWQGTLESNLNEGAAVVAAFNALAYDAAAIGNHEFDFGPEGPEAIPVVATDNPRGALQARAGEAEFPMLAANIIDTSTGDPVAWNNVQPSILLERAGVHIGLIGVTTEDTLKATISANTGGLRIAPLASTIETHARALRERGADLVVVLAHAGGYCRELDEPSDLSSCDPESEIFEVANDLPTGLVDQIVAGHRHGALANIVNGIAITSSGSGAPAFGRVDYEFDRVNRRISQRVVFPQQKVCARIVSGEQRCAEADDRRAQTATYEAIPVEPMASVVSAASRAMAVATAIKNEPLGVNITADINRYGSAHSPLGRLMTDAMLQATASDVSIHNVYGGIRSDLPAGPLTYGDVYRAFPFDNRISLLTMTVDELKMLLAPQVQKTRGRAGISGLRITATCSEGAMNLDLRYQNGQPVADDAVLKVVANDYLLLGGANIFTPIIPEEGYVIDSTQPRVRDVWVDWFRAHGGQINGEDYSGPEQQRWFVPDPWPEGCAWAG